MDTWTPTPLSLDVPPFPYPDKAISNISHTEAFNTGIDARDGAKCIVCGREDSLEYCHIVPEVENRRWEFLRSKGLIPSPSKSVRHETRNGVVMCRNHHNDFYEYRFFIRWEPVTISRIPFYGAFIDQEMRVRGRYPYLPEFADRPISFPPKWQCWITDAPDDRGGGVGESSGDSGDGGYDKGNDEWEEGEGSGEHAGSDLSATIVLTRPRRSGGQDGHNNTAENSIQANAHTSPSRTSQLVQRRPVATRPKKKNPTTIIFKDPMTNPAELEGIMRSAHQQPSWKAAVIEGESWEGTAEENIAKYLRVLPPSESPDTP